MAIRYLAAGDIADELGVPVKLLQLWRSRYGPDRTKEQISLAPTFPAPDVIVGVRESEFRHRNSTAGWRQSRMDEIRAWRDSLPGAGKGPRPSRRKGAT